MKAAILASSQDFSFFKSYLHILYCVFSILHCGNNVVLITCIIIIINNNFVIIS